MARKLKDGYVSRASAAIALRQLADDVEGRSDNQLCKFSITFWFARPEECVPPDTVEPE